MLRQGSSAALVMLLLGPSVMGQAPWRFQWQKDQELHYRVQHVTAVTEVVAGKKTETTSKLDIRKRWRVLEVDTQGTATMELALSALRNEQKRPNGEVLLFDSSDLDKSTPELKGMAKFLNTPIAVLRVNAHGQAVEVKRGPADKYEAEPPFLVVLPATAPAVGQAWVRPFTITLEPPLGNGEKHAAEQTVSCARIEDGKAILAVKIGLKTPPTSPDQRVALLQKEMAGQAVFDTQSGRLESVQLSVDRTVDDHQGQGSSYRFASTYVEMIQVPGAVVPASGTR